MKKALKILTITLIVPFLFSCQGSSSSGSKSNDRITPAVEAEEVIIKNFINKKLGVFEIKVNGQTQPTPDCLKDDYTILKPNGTYNIFVGKKCEPSDLAERGEYEIFTQAGSVYLALTPKNKDTETRQVIAYSGNTIDTKFEESINANTTTEIIISYIIKD